MDIFKFTPSCQQFAGPIMLRWTGLRCAIQETQNGRLLKALPKNEKYLFKCLLDNLRMFAHRMLEYFCTPANEPPIHYTRMYALNLVLNQVGYDLSVIQQVIAQRHIYGALLRRADRFAEAYLGSAVNAGLFLESSNVLPKKDEPRNPKPVVLTYLNKAPTIRMMPYSPIALVSLPSAAVAYSCGDEKEQAIAAREFLALAHEVGHLVFWKGYAEDTEDLEGRGKFASFLNRTLRRKGVSHYIADGVEETVADMYGALTAGISIFYTAQLKATTRQREHYFAANARYTVSPELRPSIYDAVLSVEGITSGPALMQAQDAWSELVKPAYGDIDDLGNYLSPKTVEVEAGQYRISYEVAVAEIKSAVQRIQPLLKAVQRTQIGASGKIVAKAMLVTQEEILEAASQHLSDTPPKFPLPAVQLYDLSEYQDGQPWIEPTAGNGASDYWQIWASRLLEEEQRQQEAMVKAGLEAPPYNAKDNDWYAILYAGGWVMESTGNSKGTGG